MKKIFQFFLAAVVFGLAAVSCDVERLPYNVIEQRDAFQSVKDATTMNNGLYVQLRNRVHGIYMFSTDIQADLLNASLDFGNRNGFPHRWEGFMATDYTIRDVWAGYYSALVNVNNIIENQHLIKGQNAQEEALLQRYLGEAHLLRAYYYHRLASRWGKPYNPGSAETDLGVPLMLEFNITLQPPRSTVAVTYRQILDDIAQAKTLLANTPGQQGASRITLDAVLALETRVHLYMQNWSALIPVAQQLINSGKYPLVTTEAAMRGMWHNDSGAEMIFQMYASRPSELGSSMVPLLGFRPAANDYNPDFIPQQWVVDLFAENDIRRNVYLAELPVHIQGVNYSGIYLINKFPGNPALWVGNTNYQHKPKIFRIAEVYLNLAEAQYHSSPGAALATLNTLRVARGLAPLTGLSGDALLNAIKEERTRELLAEGWRLDDLMRWGQGVQRRPPQNPNPVNTGVLYTELSKPAGHYQFIWGIPDRDLTTNPNLVQNPGW